MPWTTEVFVSLPLHMILVPSVCHQDCSMHQPRNAMWSIETSRMLGDLDICSLSPNQQEKMAITRRGFSASAWWQHSVASMRFPFRLYALARFENASQKVGSELQNCSLSSVWKLVKKYVNIIKYFQGTSTASRCILCLLSVWRVRAHLVGILKQLLH
jgi:hypothetical protein